MKRTKRTTWFVMGSLLFIAFMTGLAVRTASPGTAWAPAPVPLTAEVTGGVDPTLYIVMLVAILAVIAMHKFCAAVHRHFGVEL